MGGVGGLELFGLRKDGTEFPAEISLSPLETEDGMFAITAIRDVTARRKGESYMKALLEAAPDAMVITDGRGKVLLVNAQAEKLFGYSREELLGQRVEALIPQRFRAAHPSHRTAYFAEPRPRPMGAGHLDLYGLRKDGTEFPAEISLSPLQTEDGVLAITAIRDIAERKRTEEERAHLLEELGAAYEKSKELERLKTQFFANVSHELRTPLALIVGPADELLAADLAGGGPARRGRHRAERADAREARERPARRVEARGRQDGARALGVDVAQLVRLVAAHFDALAAERELAYAVEAPPTLPARVDPEKLQRVLFNLLSNAFKFTPVAGRIRCSLRAEERRGLGPRRGLRDRGGGQRPGRRRGGARGGVRPIHPR